MHEIGMCEGLIDLIEQYAAGRRVTAVRIRIGVRHGVVDEAFDQAFTLAAAGTMAAGATVDLVVTPVTIRCRSCGQQSASPDPLATCPTCGALDVEISGGDELVLESIQFERSTQLGPVREERPGVSRDSR
jgi:hydrogenase nickel incorporation protein HypA/HybF